MKRIISPRTENSKQIEKVSQRNLDAITKHCLADRAARAEELVKRAAELLRQGCGSFGWPNWEKERNQLLKDAGMEQK